MSRFDLPGKKGTEGFRGDFSGGDNVEDFNDPGVLRNLQSINHRLLDGREPELNELGEREIVFSIVSGVFKLHTKIQGKLKSVVLA